MGPLGQCEQGWAARTPEVLIQKGVQKHAGGPQTPDSARRGPVRAQPAFANMSRERANPNGLRKHESGTGQPPFAILTVLNMSRELFAILAALQPGIRSRSYGVEKTSSSDALLPDFRAYIFVSARLASKLCQCLVSVLGQGPQNPDSARSAPQGP